MKLVISIALTMGVLLLSTLEGIALDTNVLYVFSIVMYGMPSMMILVCGAIAFADSFCEDIEHKYVMQQVIRGDIEGYVSARIFSIFSVTMLSVTFGIFLFANIMHFKLAWVDVSGLQYDHIIHAGGLRFYINGTLCIISVTESNTVCLQEFYLYGQLIFPCSFQTVCLCYRHQWFSIILWITFCRQLPLGH